MEELCCRKSHGQVVHILIYNLALHPRRVLDVHCDSAVVVKPLPTTESIGAGSTLFQAFRTNPLRWAAHRSGRHGLSLTTSGEHSSLVRNRVAEKRRDR
jgi:hypothetical protein